MSLGNVFMVSQAVAASVAAGRLLQLRLAFRQRALFVYLCLCAVSNVSLSLFPLGSTSYFWGYVGFQSASDLACIAVVWELFSNAMQRYSGVRTAGRWILYGAVAAALIVSAVISGALWGNGASGRSNLFYVLTVHRSVQLSLAIVIVSLVIFLSHYPLEYYRNTYVSGLFFTGIFLVDAFGTIIDTLSPHLYSAQVSLAETFLIGLGFLGWAVSLRREVTEPTKVTFRTPQDEHLLDQLEALNRTLSRVGRR